MILLRLKGEKVMGVYNMTSHYTPKENEVLVEHLPTIELASDEIGILYYIDGEVVIKKEKR